MHSVRLSERYRAARMMVSDNGSVTLSNNWNTITRPKSYQECITSIMQTWPNKQTNKLTHNLQRAHLLPAGLSPSYWWLVQRNARPLQFPKPVHLFVVVWQRRHPSQASCSRRNLRMSLLRTRQTRRSWGLYQYRLLGWKVLALGCSVQLAAQQDSAFFPEATFRKKKSRLTSTFLLSYGRSTLSST